MNSNYLEVHKTLDRFSLYMVQDKKRFFFHDFLMRGLQKPTSYLSSYFLLKYATTPESAVKAFSEVDSSYLPQLYGSLFPVLTQLDKSQISFSESTSVLFSELTKEEIEFYVRQYNPLDKAGAYGIQDWIGKIGIKKINGCYYNVVGLPTQRLWREIKNCFPLSEFSERMK